MKYFIITILIIVSTVSTNSQLLPKPQVPTPAPLIREAFMPKDVILLSHPKDWKLEGKPVWLWKYNQRQLDQVSVTDVNGRKMTDEEIKKILSKPTMILLSADGKPVHPYYLSIVKPDTPVIVDHSARSQPNNDSSTK